MVKRSVAVLPTSIDNAIARFEQAAIDMAWRGSQPPENHDSIIRNYSKAKADLRNKIKEFM